MQVAQSKAPKGAQPNKDARQQPGGEASVSSQLVSSQLQRMPAYSLEQGGTLGLSLLGGLQPMKDAEVEKPDGENSGAERPARADGVQRELAEEELFEGPEGDGLQRQAADGVGGDAEDTGDDGGGESPPDAAGGDSPPPGTAADDSPPPAASGGDSPPTAQTGAGGQSSVHAVASHGLDGAAQPLPNLAHIQDSFGRHDLSGVRVQVGGQAASANESLNARAYTSGDRIAFKQEPDLHLAAHEAAHVVQQRRGVQLEGGVGQSGDPYERQADRAADAVVNGNSAEQILDERPGATNAGGGLQMECACGGAGCAACADKGGDSGRAQPAAGEAAAASAERGPLLQKDDGDGGSAAPRPQRDAQLQQEIDSWLQSVEQFEDPSQKAYSRRVVLLLSAAPNGGHFADAQALDDFVADAEQTALSELDTLSRLGTDSLVWTGAYPIVWSMRVYAALALDVDLDAMGQRVASERADGEEIAERIPAYLLDHGLPVPFAEALTLTGFELELRHAELPTAHVVKDFAAAMALYTRDGWLYTFSTAWNAIADSMSEAVADGTYMVDFQAYEDFVETRRQGLDTLAERLAEVRIEDGFRAFDTEVIDLTNVAFVEAFASTLFGLIGLFTRWADAKRMFAQKLTEADGLLAGTTDEAARLGIAFTWAHENSYFAGSASQIGRSILEHGPEILGKAALFIALQFIPIVDIAVDIYVLVTAGIDVVQAMAELVEAFNRVLSATTVVGLQRESARMAMAIEGDSLRGLLDVLAIAGTTSAIRTRIDRIRAGNPTISEEDALRQALEESPESEAATLRAARQAQEWLAANGNSNTARRALSLATGDVSVAEQLLKVMVGDASADLSIVDARLLEMAGEDLRPALGEVLAAEGEALTLRQTLLNSSRNWVEVIALRRGYPFGFASLTAFESFKVRVRTSLDRLGLPWSDIRVQGSSVARKVNPPDVDVAILVNQAEYDAIRNTIRAGIRNPRILADFEGQWPGGHMNSFYFPRVAGPQTFNQSIYGSAGGLNIDVSYVLRGGPFDQGPYLPF